MSVHHPWKRMVEIEWMKFRRWWSILEKKRIKIDSSNKYAIILAFNETGIANKW
jgi:hypothetical protein